MELAGVVLALTCFLLTVVLIPWLRRWALRTGFLDQPGEKKFHRQPVPYGGGWGILFGLFLPVIGGAVFVAWPAEGVPSWLPGEVAVHWQGARSVLPQLTAVLGGGFILFLVGDLDDRRRLPVSVRLLVHFAVALGLVLCGIRATLFVDAATVPGQVLGSVVTILWIVGMTNSFNLLDNMDGICAGIGLVVSVMLLVVALQTGQLFIAVMLFGLAGALGGFLVYNFPPARIFMGDSGSTLVGYFLGTLTILFTFYEAKYPIYAILVPLLVLAVPLFDTATVVWLRVKQRRPIMKGDTNHFSHRLVRLGLSTRGAALALYLLTASSGLAAVLLYRTDTTGALIVFSQVLVVLILVGVLESPARQTNSKSE